MAGKEFSDYRILCTDNIDDEIEGLNEKLIQLLSTQKTSSRNFGNDQSSCDSKIESNSSKVELEASASPLFSRHPYEYSCLYHDSPVKILPMHLPPIGVFWDIENCQVSLSIFNEINLSVLK